MRRQESETPAGAGGGLRGRCLAWERPWAAGWLPSDSRLFLFPQFCLLPDAGRGATASLRCPPSPARLLPGGTVGGLWLSLPVHGLTPGPFPGTVPPSAWDIHPPTGLGAHKVGQSRDPGRKGPLPPFGVRREHPRSPAPAAVWGPFPHLLHLPPFLSVVFLCQLCCFYFIPLFPFSQRNKGLEIAGPLVLVTRWRRGHHLRAPALHFCLARTDWTCHIPVL